MLKAAIDESIEDKSFFVMAGYVASAESWAAFSIEWQRHLDLGSPNHRKIDALKMSEMDISSPNDLERLEWFYRVIADHAKLGVAVSFDIQELYESIEKFPWPVWARKPEALNNPYLIGFRFISTSLAKRRYGEELGVDEPVDFVFDEHSKSKQCLEAWEYIKQSCPDHEREMIGNVPIFRPDHLYLPLQAADLLAWWIRKRHLLNKNNNEVFHYGFPWKFGRFVPELHYYLDAEQFRQLWKDSILMQEVKMAGHTQNAISYFPLEIVL